MDAEKYEKKTVKVEQNRIIRSRVMDFQRLRIFLLWEILKLATPHSGPDRDESAPKLYII